MAMRVGHRQRPEERARQAFQEEHRGEHDDHHQGRVDDGAPDLERGIQDDSGKGLGASFGAFLTQTSPDVLDVDDRVVDHFADRNDQAGEDHHVDRFATEIEDQSCGQQRQRNGDDADQRGAPFEEEEEQQHDDENAAEHQRIGQIADRNLDEGRRAENLGVDLDVLEPRRDLLERFVGAARHVERVGPGELLDDQQDAGTIIDDRIANQRRVVLDHPCDIGELELGPVLERDLAQIVRRDDRQDIANLQPLVRRIDEAARSDKVTVRELDEARIERVADRLVDHRQGHLVLNELVRLDLHRVHLDALAIDHHIGDPGHAQEARPGSSNS